MFLHYQMVPYVCPPLGVSDQDTPELFRSGSSSPVNVAGNTVCLHAPKPSPCCAAVWFFSKLPALCLSTVCPAQGKEVPVWGKRTHLSPYSSHLTVDTASLEAVSSWMCCMHVQDRALQRAHWLADTFLHKLYLCITWKNASTSVRDWQAGNFEITEQGGNLTFSGLCFS